MDDPAGPVIGCSTVDQLNENLAALEFELTDVELERLNSIETLGGLH
jgi:aryl-alcohol dehydrogenase-like predicted oxidoreductase